jgi:vacuolar-type H+-ATPase subunit F/Vma7
MTVRVLCRPELAAGFELAGLAVTRIANSTAAAAAVRRLASEADIGIILMDDGLYRALPRDLVAKLDREALPILAPVPAPNWDRRSAAEAYVMDILRQAIGYRVRPR